MLTGSEASKRHLTGTHVIELTRTNWQARVQADVALPLNTETSALELARANWQTLVRLRLTIADPWEEGKQINR